MSRMSGSLEYTPEQKAILETAGISLAVSAGAGCGKTFVLTQRFLAYLRSAAGRPDPLAGIVAITFTEKAAREMRHRVRQACQHELIRCDATEVPHWLAALRGLDTARISTIHAFCANLLRRFAVEAGIDPSFGVLDASFGDTFTRRAVREAFCRLLEAADEDASELVVRFGFERSCTMLRGLLDGARCADLSLFDNHSPESLCAVWREHWEKVTLPAQIREFWNSPVVGRVVELLKTNEPSNRVMQARRAALLELLAQVPDSDPAAVLATIRENAQVQGGGAKGAWDDEAVYEDVKTALSELRTRVDKQMELLAAADGDGIDAARLALAAHRVVRSIVHEFATRKIDEATLDFDDLLNLTRDLLRSNPQVRRRAGAGIELLMVDEFQDTDPVQAELVRLLCGEALVTGRLFVVGDAKQSIYRFRRADPHVFAALRRELPDAGRLPLATNFRSQPAILRFVNYVFGPEMPEYEPLRAADSVQHSPEPSIEFLFAPAESKSESSQDRRRREARWIAHRIAQLLADETPRVLDSATKKLRRVALGDIVILFRTLSNVHLYEQALTEQDLPYYLGGGRAFFAQQEINDLAHLCRWLDDPADELSLAGALRSPLFGLTDDTLFAIKPQKSASLFGGLASAPKLPETQGEQVRRAYRILTELREKKDRLPLGELLSLAIERTAYDAALLCEHLGPRKLANLRKLIRLAESFDAAGTFTLTEFVEQLRDAVREQADEELAVTHPEVSDVLRLMTIHQAKGLEFPVVIVADMDWKRQGGDARACYHPQFGPLFSIPDEGEGAPPHLGLVIHRHNEACEDEAELTRLLYVATTRPKDHLILSASLTHDSRPQSSWLKMLARQFDLATGLPALDPYMASADGAVRQPSDVPDVLVHMKEPLPPSAGSKTRTDHEPLRRFRELIAESTPEPLPPLVRAIAPDHSRRVEFTVSELCEADRSQSLATPTRQTADRTSDRESAEPTEYAQLIGTITHAILERIDFAGSSSDPGHSIDEEIDRALLSIRGEADARLHRRVASKLTAFIESPLYREMAMARRLFREVGFRLRWTRPDIGQPAQIIGTIDCLYESSDGGWHLIDYKTVDEAGSSEQELVSCYGLQIAAYALAVEQLCGEPPRSAHLVRLGPPIAQYAVPVTRESLESASRRVDDAIRLLRTG